jgi:hypothetical protein
MYSLSLTSRYFFTITVESVNAGGEEEILATRLLREAMRSSFARVVPLFAQTKVGQAFPHGPGGLSRPVDVAALLSFPTEAKTIAGVRVASVGELAHTVGPNSFHKMYGSQIFRSKDIIHTGLSMSASDFAFNLFDAQGRPQALLAGSSMVQAALGESWDGSDIDVFCTHQAAPLVRAQLVRSGALMLTGEIYSGYEDESKLLESNIHHVSNRCWEKRTFYHQPWRALSLPPPHPSRCVLQFEIVPPCSLSHMRFSSRAIACYHHRTGGRVRVQGTPRFRHHGGVQRRHQQTLRQAGEKARRRDQNGEFLPDQYPHEHRPP